MMIDADKGIGDDGRCRAGVGVNFRLIRGLSRARIMLLSAEASVFS
jgi:hypothetical protein